MTPVIATIIKVFLVGVLVLIDFTHLFALCETIRSKDIFGAIVFCVVSIVVVWATLFIIGVFWCPRLFEVIGEPLL